jgi:hypothetical protein
MRLVASVILAAAMLGVALPAQAQTYDPRWPICLKIYNGGIDGGGEVNDCSYTSMPQCQAAAFGRAAVCMINPYGSMAQRSAQSRAKASQRTRQIQQ